ncbi:MAG TPA: DUF222 domain-containing protein [Mycobacteriales bacterium]|nr:DUF222 domain-containing protein [Mycobacteriales bacterium]
MPGEQPDPPAAVSDLVQDVQHAVRALIASPPTGRPTDVGAVLRLAEQLRGLGLRELAELDASGQYRDDEAPNAAVWLRRAMVLGDDSARAAVRLSGRLREELPLVLDQLIAGDTTLEHVRAAAAGTAGLDPDLVRGAQGSVGQLLLVADPATVRRQLRERAEAIDPELARDAVRRQRARQGLFADVLAGAGVVLSGSLCDEDGAVLLHGLDLAVEADRAAGDTRSLPARRAAVLVKWALLAAHADAPGDSLAQDAHTVRTQFLLTCTADQLTALAQGQAISQLDALAVLRGATPVTPACFPTGAGVLPEALRRLACDAAVTVVVQRYLAGERGEQTRAEPLYVGRSARTISGAQFKALVVRDRRCVVRGCHRRPAQCAGHHVRHWLDGGLSDLDNLVLLCHVHHHDHHDRGHDLQHHDGRWMTASGWAHAPP